MSSSLAGVWQVVLLVLVLVRTLPARIFPLGHRENLRQSVGNV